MTEYPEPMNNPHSSMADNVREILEIRALFERPIELMGVSAYEMSSMYLPRLRNAIGDTVSFKQLVAQNKIVTDHMRDAAKVIGEMRMKLEAVAKAIERAGEQK